jgi:hypothetical protein
MIRRVSLAGLLAGVLAGLLAGVLAAMLAACGGSRGRGPAWPERHEREADGGESLEPRQASSVAALENAEDEKPTATEPASGGAAGAAGVSAPAAKPDDPASEAPSLEDPDVLTTEEITIEIEED